MEESRRRVVVAPSVGATCTNTQRDAGGADGPPGGPERGMFVCQVCQRGFNTRRGLNIHKTRMKHREASPPPPISSTSDRNDAAQVAQTQSTTQANVDMRVSSRSRDAGSTGIIHTANTDDANPFAIQPGLFGMQTDSGWDGAGPTAEAEMDSPDQRVQTSHRPDTRESLSKVESY